MVWVIVGAAVVVLGFAAVASTGRLGELRPPVDDRFAGRIPAEVTADNVGDIVFARARDGYDMAQVDSALPLAAEGLFVLEADDVEPFSSATRGYDRAQVRAVFAQLGQMRNNGGAVSQAEMREPHGSDEATHR